MGSFLSAAVAAIVAVLVTAWIARGVHRRALRRRLAEYGRGHARLRELEAELRVAWTRHEVALEAMRRERRALAVRSGSPRVGEPMLTLDVDDREAPTPTPAPGAAESATEPSPVIAAGGAARA